MSFSNLPTDWKPYISSSFNRIYLNPASGCSANCAYCYIFEVGHPRRPRLFPNSARELVSWLVEQKTQFRPGRNGTLLSLSATCDAFAPDVITKTLEFVETLAPLGNPIQLSTKYYLDAQSAKSLAACQVAPGQIVVNFTVTSFEKWKKIEPGALPPSTRLEGLSNAKAQGITSCLAIKPVIPGITDQEIDRFVKAIQDFRIPYCSIGVMYLSAVTTERFVRRQLVSKDFNDRLKERGHKPPPCDTHRPEQEARDIYTLDLIRRMKPALESAGACCVISSPCIVALSYNIICPTGVWRYLPHLCVSCNVACPERFRSASPSFRASFPHIVEGLRATGD